MNIQMKEAREIARRWKERRKGNPELRCDHTKPFYKEYMLGTATGDYVCPVCGETFSEAEIKGRRGN